MTSVARSAEIGREDGRARAGAGRQRLAVSIAFLANGLLIGSWAPQIPIFAARFGLTPATMAYVILAFGVGAVIAMPLVGRVIARRGSRAPMLALHLALALALPAIALAPSVWFGVLAVVFTGIATGGMDVAMNANAVNVERRMPSAIMSSCHGFWSVGGLVGAGLGGFAITGLGPLAHALLVGAAIALVFVPVQRFALFDGADGETSAQTPASGASGAALSPASRAAGYRTAAVIGCFALFAMIPEGAAIDWSAFYLRRELGMPEQASGFAFAAFSATMAIMRFAGDGVRNRLGAVRTAQVCSLAAIAGLLLAGLSVNGWMAIAGFAIMGIGISNIVPIAFSAAGNVRGLRAGTALSIVTSMGYSGILIAPTFIGYFGEHFSFAAVFLCLSVFLVATFIAAPLMKAADDRSELGVRSDRAERGSGPQPG